MSANAAPVQTPVQIKKIGHVVLRVSDVERSARFWTELLGFKVSDYNEQGMVFLRNASDHHTIALAPATDLTPLSEARPGGIGFHHMALEVDNASDLLRIRDYLREHNVPIVFEGRRGAGSNPGVEFRDPDGFMVEIYAQMDQIGPDGRSRPPEEWKRADSLEAAFADPVAGVKYR